MSFFARSGAISGLPQLLDEFDVELAPLLQSFGLPLDLCQEDDSLVEIGLVVTHAIKIWRLLSNNQWRPQEVFFSL